MHASAKLEAEGLLGAKTQIFKFMGWAACKGETKGVFYEVCQTIALRSAR